MGIICTERMKGLYLLVFHVPMQFGQRCLRFFVWRAYQLERTEQLDFYGCLMKLAEYSKRDQVSAKEDYFMAFHYFLNNLNEYRYIIYRKSTFRERNSSMMFSAQWFAGALQVLGLSQFDENLTSDLLAAVLLYCIVGNRSSDSWYKRQGCLSKGVSWLASEGAVADRWQLFSWSAKA